MNELQQKLFYRSVSIDQRSVDEKTRSVELAISSETPVKRWFGDEILLHEPDAVDFSRLNSALLNHDPAVIVGRVDDPRLVGKKVRATIYFDDDADGEKAFLKVKSGSLKGASVGYVVERYKVLEEGEAWNEFEGPCYIAVKWSIYETSLTPIPADPTVGIGREATRSLDGIEVEESRRTGGGVSSAEYLLARAGARSPELKSKAAEMLLRGATAAEVELHILGAVSGDAAQTDKGAGTTTHHKDGKRRLDQIPDDVFARSLAHMG